MAGMYGGTRFGAGQGVTDEERARQSALVGYDRAAAGAGQAALGQAMSVQGSSPFAAQRMAIDAGSQARANIMGQRAEAEGRMIQQQQMMAEMRKREAEQRARQMIGGIVGGAGQVLGTIMPAFAPAGAAAGMLGGAIGGQPMGGAMMGQAPPPTAGAPTPVATNAGMPGRPAQPVGAGGQSMSPPPSAGPTAPPADPRQPTTVTMFGRSWSWDPGAGQWSQVGG